MPAAQFFDQIRDLIARDELDSALTQLRLLLDNSPKLDEVILQSARFRDIRRQISLGIVSHQEATLTQNQIRAAMLELIAEMEQQVAEPGAGEARSHPDTSAAALRAEVEGAMSIVHQYGDKSIYIEKNEGPINIR